MKGKNKSGRYVGIERLSPAKRFKNYCMLYDFYIRAGGSLAPERDSQSPYDFPQYYREARGTIRFTNNIQADNPNPAKPDIRKKRI